MLVVLFLGKRGYELWNQDDLQQLQINVFWLIPSGIVYLIGGIPAVWFWRELMQSFGGTIRFRDALQAYYCSQLGRYVPGKATVLIIRAAMLKNRGLGPASAAVTATAETLIMMGVGLAMTLALSPVIGWPDWIHRLPNTSIMAPIMIFLLCLAALPVISFLLTSLSVRMTPAEMRSSEEKRRIPAKLIACGFVAFTLTWILFGLSLGFTIRSISGLPLDLENWPLWTGAITAATAIGFLAIFAPGGIGVREGLLLLILSLHIPEKQAIAAGILLRIVWFVAEITLSSLLYYMYKKGDASAPDSSETKAE